MADTFIRVRDTRTNEILPNEVPAAWLDIFPHLKELASSSQVTEPETAPTRDTIITEPATPEKRGNRA